VAQRLNTSPIFNVPAPLPAEQRAPDSIQFNLVDMNDDDIDAFATAAAERGLKLQIFGRSTDNARAFWNWKFLGDQPDLPQTRAMLMRACDLRLPARLTLEDCDKVADVLLDIAKTFKRSIAA